MNILVGICGSIAAYKSPDFVRALLAKGHTVEVCATPSALQFTTRPTLETFLGKSLISSNPFELEPVGTDHIKWARWADAIIIYGATAHTLAKLALAMGDDLIGLQVLATRAPVLIAPAMNPEMWANSLVQNHVTTLRNSGKIILGPIHGTVACGETGIGHIVETEEICNHLESLAKGFGKFDFSLAQNKFLVTLGPMQSNLDTARHLTNKSSGRMGLEICRALRHYGADVTVVAGSVDSDIKNSIKSFKNVFFNSSQEYEKILDELFPLCDAFVSAAAVLDFEFVPQPHKLSRKSFSTDRQSFSITPVKDFVKKYSQIKKSHQKVYAFAAEDTPTEDAIKRASQKLVDKKCDAVFLNPISESTGFESLTNHFWILAPNANPVDLGFDSKARLAHKLAYFFFNDLNNRNISSLAFP